MFDIDFYYFGYLFMVTTIENAVFHFIKRV